MGDLGDGQGGQDSGGGVLVACSSITPEQTRLCLSRGPSSLKSSNIALRSARAYSCATLALKASDRLVDSPGATVVPGGYRHIPKLAG